MALQTQQRLPTSTTGQASFFLSPQQASKSSHFMLTSSPSANKQQKRLKQNFCSSTNTSSYVSSYSKNQQKEAELEAQSSGRLTVLHSRLQQEAEKIRKWKNATELELKHKEKCLEEATHTIQNQQESLTELQLQKESLASKLKDEIANQTEIRRKISSTRDMCTALKNHSIKIDKAICKGQEDKDHLMLTNQDTMIKYQDLLVKYQLLEEGQKEWHKKYEDELSAERNKYSVADNMNKEISQKLKDSNNEILLLENQRVEGKLLIQSLKGEMETKRMECETLGKENDDLDHALSVKEDSIRKLEKQVYDVTQELLTSQQEVGKCSEDLEKTQNILQENERTYSEKLSQLEISLSSKTAECKQSLDANSDLETKLDETTTELSDKFHEASKELEKRARDLQISQEAYQSSEVELSQVKKSLEELEATKNQMKDRIEEIERELGLKEDELETQITEKQNGLEKAESLISDVVSRHSKARECWVEKERVMEMKIDEMKGDKLKLKSEAMGLNSQLEDLNTSMNTQLNEKISQITKLEEYAHELTTEKGALMEVNHKLEEQIQTLNENKEKLASQCSDKDQIIEENLKLKISLDTKNTESEHLQAKIVQIQTETSSESRELTAQMEKMKDEILSLTSKGSENEKAYELNVAEMKKEMRLKSDNLTSLVEHSRKETEAAKKKLDQEKKDCEREVQDLVAALDSYRAEHEKTITVKDKTIETLNYQFQQSEKSKEISDHDLKDCQEKIQRLESEIGTKNEELKDLLRSIEFMCLKENSSSSTPRRKTPQVISQTHTPKTVTKSISMVNDNEVSSTPKHLPNSKCSSSTPKLSSSKPSLSGSNPSHQTSCLPSNTPRSFSVLSTPNRVYNYSVTATPQCRSKLTHNTTRYAERTKRTQHHQIDAENENQTRTKRRNNVSYAQEDDEAVFKKPKLKDTNITIQRASSTTISSSKVTSKAKKQSSIGRNRRSKTEREMSDKEVSEDLSWFDLDSVYGFGINDC